MSTLLNRLVNGVRGIGRFGGARGGRRLGVLGLLMGSTATELRRQIRYLKAENEVLRSKVAGPVRVTRAERSKLVKFATPVGRAVCELVSIVKPDTLLRWMNGSRPKRRRTSTRKPGRPKTAAQIRSLVLRMARENAWGYTRILGELKKLRIKIGRGTVVNILKEAGIPTSPQRRESSWDEFAKAHAETLWACDFLRQPVITVKGVVEAFVLIFINVMTRRAYATASTTKPTEEWTAAEGEKFLGGRSCSAIIRDRDSSYGKMFDEVMRAHGVKPVALPHRAPNLNAHVERLIQSIQVECLDRFIVLGTGHLDHLIAQYVEHYNTERPHSGIGHRTPVGPAPPKGNGAVRCRARLGGVLRSYFRAAA